MDEESFCEAYKDNALKMTSQEVKMYAGKLCHSDLSAFHTGGSGGLREQHTFLVHSQPFQTKNSQHCNTIKGSFLKSKKLCPFICKY